MRNETTAALARRLDLGEQTGSDRSIQQKHELDVTVLFTSPKATRNALQQAAVLAGELDARITLLVPQVVPYPLPLSSPPILIDFNERRFRVIAERIPIETTVLVYLCRDRDDALANVLPPHSLVIFGDRHGWWPTSEKRLARKLRRRGHPVILTETE